MRTFADLKLVKLERVDRCTFKDNQICVRLHVISLQLCKKMAVEEEQAWHTGLINGYRSVLEEGKVLETGSGLCSKVEDDGHIS